MYTSQENVRIAIAMLKQYDIRKVVISPGGTNMPVVQALQQDPFFECYSVYDERSAIYFAIGLYLKSGEPIVASCTSAQATRNYVPGLTEAFYKHVPIIALTTAKLKRYEYQEYMQAPDQCSLPKDCVRASFDLPPVTDDNTRVQCTQFARNAILESFHGNKGPVQLNIRIVDSKLKDYGAYVLPDVVMTKRFMAWDEWDKDYLKEKKVLVVVGEHLPFTNRQQLALENFAWSHNVAIYVNNISNYHGKYAVHGNLLLTCDGISNLVPDIVITIGGQTGDYSIFRSLNKVKFEHWRVCEDGQPTDTYNQLTRIYECPDYYFFERMVGLGNSSHSYYEEWEKRLRGLNLDIDIPFSNLYIAQQLYSLIPQGSVMNFAIHNSLRCWNFFPLNPSIDGYANVAAFGIDGCNSMLIGESMLTDKLCFIVTGDLAFFYDMNAIGIRHIKNNVRVLLINNGYGVEFALLTRSMQDSFPIDDYVAAKGHNGSAKGWAESCGFKYLSATNKSEFNDVKEQFISVCSQPILLEVFTNGQEETMAHSAFIRYNIECKSIIKKNIKNILGEDNVKKIKTFFK